MWKLAIINLFFSIKLFVKSYRIQKILLDINCKIISLAYRNCAQLNSEIQNMYICPLFGQNWRIIL